MPFVEYRDLWELKENNYRRMDPKQAAVIFMDCRDVTKNHRAYNLMTDDPVYKTMADSAFKVAEELMLDCTIYAGIDEASVIFTDIPQLRDAFQMDDCADYVLALYMQRFLKHFWKRYSDIFIKNTIFNIPFGKTKRFIDYRRSVCRTVACFYQAKEKLSPELYKDIDFAEQPIRDLLMKYDLFDILRKNDAFYNGIEISYTAPSFLSFMAKTVSRDIESSAADQMFPNK